MSNTQHTRLPYSVSPRRSKTPNAQQTRGVVRQDNPAPPPARVATPQPAPPTEATRSHQLQTNSPRSQKRPNFKRKTVQVVLWVKPLVKAEVARIAEAEGLSVSSVGSAFLEKAVQEDLHTQHGALLETIIEKAIRKHLRSYSNRIAILLVRALFASEQTRSIVTNILNRQPGVTQPVLENILNGSSNAAKRNITRVTPQLKELIEAVEKWIGEGESTHA